MATLDRFDFRFDGIPCSVERALEQREGLTKHFVRLRCLGERIIECDDERSAITEFTDCTRLYPNAADVERARNRL